VRGTLIVGWDGRLALEESVRRSAIAGALVAEARRRVSNHGAVRIDAMVNTDNLAAVAFSETAGFGADPHDGRWSLVVWSAGPTPAQSPVEGSMTLVTRETLSAGKPPQRACS
jgi:hypothetical protein